MHTTLKFLTSDDERLLMERAETRRFQRDDRILEEGSHRAALFLIGSGAVRVERAHFGRGVSFARLGPGDLFGEISFLDAAPASATIFADDDEVEVAMVDGPRLYSLLVSVPGFAARFYQSLATTLAVRLRETSALLPPLLIEDVPQVNRFHAPRASATGQAQLPPSLIEAVDAFKNEMMQAELALQKKKLDDDSAQAKVSAACSALSDALRDHVAREAHLEEGIGGYVFRETFSFLMRSANIDRWFTKPRGYAGDFFSIELIYRNNAEGEGRLGRFVDRWALGLTAAQAVRNRRGLLAGAIRDAVDRSPGETTLVTSLASGPARELFDVLTQADAPAIQATCIDIDNEALAFGSERARELGVSDRIHFAQDNVLRLSRGRGKTTIPQQHLIYSVGLIDYLQDEHIVRLLDWAHDQLLPGGTVILGNFDVDNPHKAFMDHVLEWRLIHRTPADLRRMFAASKFGTAPVDVRVEEAGVNLFAFCTRDGETATAARQTGTFAVMEG